MESSSASDPHNGHDHVHENVTQPIENATVLSADSDSSSSQQEASLTAQASDRELDRLWEWGLHEDELLVNRMSVALLAQSILLVAAVGALTASSANTADRIVEIVLDIVGLVITASLWHVFRLHEGHIKILSYEQRALEPHDAVYARVHRKMADERNRSWIQRRIFGSSRGTKWIMANVLSVAILVTWLAILGAAISSA